MKVEYSAALVEKIKAGIAWLQSEQKPDAVVTHHGVSAPADAPPLRYISLSPRGYANRPVLIFSAVYLPKKPGEMYAEGYEYTEDDIKILRQMITEAGGEISHHWNGAGLPTVSFSLLNEIGNGVKTALNNYVPFKHDAERVVTTPDGWH